MKAEKKEREIDRLRKKSGQILKVHKSNKHQEPICGSTKGAILSTLWKDVDCKACLKRRQFRITKNAFIPIYVDPAIVDLTRNQTSMRELIPNPSKSIKKSLPDKMRDFLRRRIRIDWEENWED